MPIPEYIVPTASDYHAPGTDNTPAVVTYSAQPNVRHMLFKVVASYSAAPTGGMLTITRGAATVFSVRIANAGPVDVTFSPPIASNTNEALTVTLAAGGSGVSGTVWCERIPREW